MRSLSATWAQPPASGPGHSHRDREDPYLRTHVVRVFVRDRERVVRFHQLLFQCAPPPEDVPPAVGADERPRET